jgi:hypothetical protein
MKYFVVYKNIYENTELIPTDDFEKLFVELQEKFNVKFTPFEEEENEYFKNLFIEKETNFYVLPIWHRGSKNPVGSVTAFYNPLLKGEENE